jgi:hypothetical protein
MDQNQVNLIVEIGARIHASAAKRKEDAALGGFHHDGGASESIRKYETWIDGIEFARTGKTAVYKELKEQIDNENDSEYQEYLRLKKRFEK